MRRRMSWMMGMTTTVMMNNNTCTHRHGVGVAVPFLL